jgi:NADH-quinone oxidoreductase subunit L
VLIGALANAGLPPFAGFLLQGFDHRGGASVDHVPGAGFAYPLMRLAGVFVGGFYSFRLVFFAFHGKERFRPGARCGGHAMLLMRRMPRRMMPTTTTVTTMARWSRRSRPGWSPVPLILLAIPSVDRRLADDRTGLFGNYFGGAIYIAPSIRPSPAMAADFHGALGMIAHGLMTPPFWLASGRRGDGLVSLYRAARPAGRDQAEVRRAGPHPGEKYGFDRVSTTGSSPAAPACSAAACGRAATRP